MDRRKFTKTTIAAALGGIFAKGALAQVSPSNPAKPFKLKFAPNLNQCKTTLKGLSVSDKIKYFYDCGFRALEDNGMPNRPREEQDAIAKTMSDLGMEMGVFCTLIPFNCALMTNFIMPDDTSKKPKPDKKRAREYMKKKMPFCHQAP